MTLEILIFSAPRFRLHCNSPQGSHCLIHVHQLSKFSSGGHHSSTLSFATGRCTRICSKSVLLSIIVRYTCLQYRNVGLRTKRVLSIGHRSFTYRCTVTFSFTPHTGPHHPQIPGLPPSYQASLSQLPQTAPTLRALSLELIGVLLFNVCLDAIRCFMRLLQRNCFQDLLQVEPGVCGREFAQIGRRW